MRREELEELSLSSEQVNICKEKFFSLDTNSRGSINRMDLRVLLEQCGEATNEPAWTQLFTWLDESGLKRLDLHVALKAFNKLKLLNEAEADDSDIDVGEC